jgi:hypothetical protein
LTILSLPYNTLIFKYLSYHNGSTDKNAGVILESLILKNVLWHNFWPRMEYWGFARSNRILDMVPQKKSKLSNIGCMIIFQMKEAGSGGI